MSRIGIKPVIVPAGVEASVDANNVVTAVVIRILSLTQAIPKKKFLLQCLKSCSDMLVIFCSDRERPTHMHLSRNLLTIIHNLW